MWFKNLTVYKLREPWTLTAAALEERLTRQALTPCASLELESQGWVAPRDNGGIVESFDRQLLIALGIETKLLPATVVNDAAKARAAAFERARGFKPGRKALREFKEQALVELAPRALVRRRTVRAWIDGAAGRLIVDAASDSVAEKLTERLRETVGELPLQRLDADPAASTQMTRWLASGKAPGPLALGADCELVGASADKPTVGYRRHPLNGGPIRRHLEDGLRVRRLGLSWNERLDFMLDDELRLRRLRYLPTAESEGERDGDPDPRFEADFRLMVGEFAALLDDIERLMRVDAAPPEPEVARR